MHKPCPNPEAQAATPASTDAAEVPREAQTSASPTAKRRLRLSTILIQLGAEARPDISVAPEGETDAQARPERPSRRSSRKPRVRSNLTLGEIVDRTAHAGFGFLMAFLALVSIPFVGVSLPFGLAIGFAGVQMMAGRERPWLPKRLRRHVVTIGTLDWLSQRVSRWTSGLERLIKPRLSLLARGPFWVAVGAGIVLEGIGLALPVPVPGSNFFFVLPILFYSIGLLEDDGVLILLGHLFAAAHVVLAILFWHVIHKGILDAIRWFSG